MRHILITVTRYIAEDGCSPENPDCLPAWRWQDAAFSLKVKGGPKAGLLAPFRGLAEAILRVFASLLFAIAGLVWRLVMTFLRWGVNLDIVDAASARIDRTFHLLAGGFKPAVAVAVVASFLVVMWRMVKGDSRAAGRLVVTTGIAFTLMLSWTANTSSSDGFTTPAPSLSTPGGTVLLLNQKVNLLAGPLEDTMFSALTELESDSVGNGLHCNAYREQLYKQWFAANPDNPRATSTAALSKLWESAYLSLYRQAQFGSPEVKSHVDCRVLEQSNGTLMAEQVSLTQAAIAEHGGPVITDAIFVPLLDETTAWSIAGFDSSFDKDDYERNIVAWMMCDYSNGQWTTPPINQAMLDKLPEIFRAIAEKKITPDACATDWWTNEDLIPNEGFGNRFAIALIDTSGGVPDVASETELSTNPVLVRKAATSYAGGTNNVTALMMGLAALIIALIYLVVFGALSLGLLMAQLGIIASVVMLPVVVVKTILPSRNPQNEIVNWVKYLVGALAVGALFTTGLMFLIILINMFQGLAGPVTGGGSDSSLEKSFFIGLSPILALLTIRSVLKKIGMVDITRPGEALKLGTAVVGGGIIGEGVGDLLTRGRSMGRRYASGRARGPVGRGFRQIAKKGGGGADGGSSGGAGQTQRGLRTARTANAATGTEPATTTAHGSAVGGSGAARRNLSRLGRWSTGRPGIAVGLGAASMAAGVTVAPLIAGGALLAGPWALRGAAGSAGRLRRFASDSAGRRSATVGNDEPRTGTPAEPATANPWGPPSAPLPEPRLPAPDVVPEQPARDAGPAAQPRPPVSDRTQPRNAGRDGSPTDHRRPEPRSTSAAPKSPEASSGPSRPENPGPDAGRGAPDRFGGGQ